MNRYWPVVDLRLSVGDIELRPMTEADLPELAELKPDDVEIDPRLPDFGANRKATALYQSYWASVGNWRPDDWRLNFVVYAQGELAGVQDLEAEGFAARRTVETESWLMEKWRGRGVGKAMRLAVLALAFDGLGAELALTEAWQDNNGSLGVSRSLGYVDNGITRHMRGPMADEMARMRLTRETWLARHSDHAVVIEGLAACRRFFVEPGEGQRHPC